MNLFISFIADVSDISLPKKFTFPFYYETHPLAELAANELQDHLINQTDWEHNFGLDNTKKGEAIGKMFGVLVVKNKKNELGYLAAFSGKIADKNVLPKFVPPVYDSLTENGFFEKDRIVTIALSQEIMNLENDVKFIELQKEVIKNTKIVKELLLPEVLKLKARKKDRAQRKKEALKKLSVEEYQLFQQKIAQESLNSTFYLRELTAYYQSKYLVNKSIVMAHLAKIKSLQKIRNTKSNRLQEKLFEQYSFLNKEGVSKKLTSIFDELKLNPPAGTGDCAAPKLLQYAFENGLELITMAEFWWGNSQTATIRKHKNYYPSCKGKCEPILNHMLIGTEMDDNPFLKNPAKDKKIAVIFEDDFLVVINKPTELLSVPGKIINDSVYTRMQKRYPTATGPLLVHRLDMSTSGIMLIAKTKEVHKDLQRQFIDRTVTKKYRALLAGIITKKEGEINLPMRVDLNNRPRQLICYDYGKAAKTKWKVLACKDEKTKIEFTPITGRTHQLRVHAAHKLGLNTAIVGDDLYGTKSNRLHLHAAYIKFRHPKSEAFIEFNIPENF